MPTESQFIAPVFIIKYVGGVVPAFSLAFSLVLQATNENCVQHKRNAAAVRGVNVNGSACHNALTYAALLPAAFPKTKRS